MHIKVGTRGSKLALTQTNWVIDQLQKAYPKDSFEAVVIKTTGDKIQNKALDAIGSKGVFVDEIENQLLSGDIQLAVHSMKDMPEEPAKGLVFSKAWKREDPRDVLILREADCLLNLRKNAVIATGSKRREFQLKAIRPDIRVVGIRGNIDTRIRKLNEPLEDGTYLDGIVLAAAGVHRIGRGSEITQYLSVDEMIPAPAQGILAIELREDNLALLEMINALSDDKSNRAAIAEREFLKASGGDCHKPVGAFLDTDNNILYGYTGNEDGTEIERTKVKYEQ